jgi:hypothetical protein
MYVSRRMIPGSPITSCCRTVTSGCVAQDVAAQVATFVRTGRFQRRPSTYRSPPELTGFIRVNSAAQVDPGTDILQQTKGDAMMQSVSLVPLCSVSWCCWRAIAGCDHFFFV